MTSFLHREVQDAQNNSLFYLDQGEINLVTFGSPLSHLYSTYFSEAYPGWETEENGPTWGEISDIIRGWLNVYRLDDPIGATVFPESDQLGELEGRYMEFPIGEGGHQHYWRDLEFFNRLFLFLNTPSGET